MGWSSINDNFYQSLMGYQQAGPIALGVTAGTPVSTSAASAGINPWANQSVDSFTSTTFPFAGNAIPSTATPWTGQAVDSFTSNTKGGINAIPNFQTLMLDPFAYTSEDNKQKFAEVQNAVGSVTNGLGGILNSAISNPANFNSSPSMDLPLNTSSSVKKSTPNKKVKGKVGDWIAKAQKILKAHGVPLDKMDAKDIAIIIKHESGGNPTAKNNWDSNAAKGTPSIGLMQTIGPTFNAHKLPGHDSITDPVDNIIAGVRYAIKRYGSVSNVPGVKKVKQGQKYVGY